MALMTRKRADPPVEGIVVQVRGRLPTHALEQISDAKLQTVLRASVSDQAALYGLLQQVRDLGLDLVSLRQLPPGSSPEEPGEISEPHDGIAPFEIEIVVEGPIGDLAISALAAHVEVSALATRIVLLDRQAMGSVLECALSAGAEVEFAKDLPR
jgi:hypothetical protein